MPLEQLLQQQTVILDGALGTQLQQAGLQPGENPEAWSIEHPEVITRIHRSYIDAGADIIYSNTFGANRYKLADSPYSVQEIITASLYNARSACEHTSVKVALDIGPIGQMLAPMGTLSFEEAYDIFKEIVAAGREAADLIVIETMTDLREIKAAVLAAKENSSLPVLCTMTFEENGRTFTGTSPGCMALTIGGLGVDAIGLNCSLGPDQVEPILAELAKWTELPIILKPNAGLPDPLTNRYNIDKKSFADEIEKLLPHGLAFIGGCCGTNPEYIAELTKRFKPQIPLSNKKRDTIPPAVCSATRVVTFDEPRIVGERINPTGKTIFQKALQEKNLNYILGQAIEQIDGGAEILDVNVGMPGIDEEIMLAEVMSGIQEVCDVPLQIDSNDAAVIARALRFYNGKAIVNSVTGEEESMQKILPLVHHYGAAVVGLTLDEKGIPKTAAERFEIAEKICKRAEEFGIPRNDIIIDCLTLTASAEQASAQETLTAVEMVKEQLGVRTILGVSNISFGLPNRDLLNHNFLAMALFAGLDLAIINPNKKEMVGAVRSYRLLANLDANAKEYIEVYGQKSQQKKRTHPRKENQAMEITEAIEKGLKGEAAALTRVLLNSMEAMTIVNDKLIPALDTVGENFETGRIFLPQLLQSAAAAQEAFSIIREKLNTTTTPSVSKGTIVIATVKGDIHDIGKNIAKVLLENYGYTVIDLGRNVDPETIVNAVEQYDCHLVGLSALMTTTLKSMEKTIQLLQNRRPNCRIMVGGAVLTPGYAKEIGANYYAKDAKEGTDIAKDIYG